MASKAWPYEEARKLLKRWPDGKPDGEPMVFETGYGPSGLPHIGTFNEVLRTTFVRQAYEELTGGAPTRLIAFSDDMDGLRKVPDNVPEHEMLSQHLGKPLTRIPDPFGSHESFAHHNNAMLRHFLDRYGFDYEFLSATECYSSGRFDEVVRSANGERVIGYSYAVDKREVVYFDPEYKALHASLSRAIPKLPLINFLGASQDGGKILLLASADNDPGRYFVFDKTAKRLNEVMLVRPELEKRTLAEVNPVTVTSTDGTPMPAYLTLPVGKDPKNLPAIVLPHGGPSSRDEWGFDWLAQFLAARGYAVLQPNYRGSAGFGDAWLMENGFKSWRTSIGDITASAKWLASQGIANPKRIAIVGWSYGGYAALQSAAVEPGLFKAVAAIAPVTDLSMLKRESGNFSNRDLVAQYIGSGPHIEEGSPLRRAAQIKVPVLLVHGDMDQNVGVAESVEMEQALRKNGTPVQFLRYRSLDHQLDDATARREMLTSIGTLLEKTIGR